MKLRKKLDKIMERLTEIRSMDELTDEIREERDGLLTQAKTVKADLEREEEMRKFENDLNSAPVVPNENPEIETRSGVDLTSAEKKKPVYRNLAEQIADIVAIGTPSTRADLREKAHNRLSYRAATGMSASLDPDVGYAIQTDFAGMMLESAVKDDPFLSLVDTYTLSESADRVSWIEVDESSVATTVHGGVQVYWRGEGLAPTASSPKMLERELDIHKLMGLCYVTDEVMKHASFVSQWLNNAFTTAIRYKLAGDIISDGTGVGRPQSILASPATLTHAIGTGQTSANPILFKNIVGMWIQLLPDMRSGAVWLVHPDMEEQLEYIDFPVGTGGVPVFLTAGGGIGAGVSTLKQRPVIPSMHCSALNSKGDIILCNPRDYMLVTKGGVEATESMHVRYIYAENALRWIFYANGMVKRAQALTIKNSSTQRSSFVTLAARS